MGTMKRSQIRTRFVADRFRRIWVIAEEIAAHPGHTRRSLADMYHLSERQLQSDLNIMRIDMRLPLVRRSGYRFMAEGPDRTSGGGLSLSDAQTMLLLIGQARRDRSILPARIDELAAKLPALCSPHVEPLARRMLAGAQHPQHQIFAALGDAIMRGAWVKLISQPRTFVWPLNEPVIQPELLLPYLDRWFVLGVCRQTGRSLMLDLGAAAAVALAEVPDVRLD